MFREESRAHNTLRQLLEHGAIILSGQPITIFDNFLNIRVIYLNNCPFFSRAVVSDY